MKGATYVTGFEFNSIYHFNPRTREGCDLNAGILYEGMEVISIHAPVKGATFFWIDSVPICIISIHAPVKGATVQQVF